MTFPLWWYILIRTLKKTDGHHVFRKAAEAVYREIIDNHWLRTMAASSKDGLSTLGKHMSPLSIQSHWLLLPHPTTTNLGSIEYISSSTRGFINTCYQPHGRQYWRTQIYIWSRTPILMLHQSYLKTIVTEGAHLRNSISSDNVQQIKINICHIS